MATDKKKNTTQPDSIIRVKAKTKERLEELRHPGQSYDGVMEEILNFWEENHDPRREEAHGPPPPAVAPQKEPAKTLSWWWPAEMAQKH